MGPIMPEPILRWSSEGLNPNLWELPDNFGTYSSKKHKVIVVNEGVSDEEVLERLRKQIKLSASTSSDNLSQDSEGTL